jgi:hypothetical protein
MSIVGSLRRRVPVEVLLAPCEPYAGAGADGLSHEERSRASAIADPDERDRFYGGRRLLRQALGQRTGRPPRDLEIASGRNGQAFLFGGGPFFSLAHSERWYAIALCDELPVGAAVAALGDRPALTAVVDALLPPRAREDIELAAPEQRSETTLHWWLTMEAAIRACGASRDQAAACLDRVNAVVGRPLPGAMAAVAGCTKRSLQVHWRVLASDAPRIPA